MGQEKLLKGNTKRLMNILKTKVDLKSVTRAFTLGNRETRKSKIQAEETIRK